MIDLSIFAERLKELMIENDLNASSVANKLEIDKSTISRYLSEEKIPTVENAVNLANLFNCTIDFLLGFKDENVQKDFLDCPPFSERLAFLLEDNKKSQYALRKKTKISQSLIYYWLHNIYSPSLDNIVKIAEFFECSIDYVLGRVKYK